MAFILVPMYRPFMADTNNRYLQNF